MREGKEIRRGLLNVHQGEPNKQYLQAQEKKFSVPQPEMDMEQFLTKITPRATGKNEVIDMFINNYVEQIQKSSAQADAKTGMINAASMWKMSLVRDAEDKRIDTKFAVDFYNWLMGKGTDADHQKTEWGRAPIRDEECGAYIRMFLEAKIDFQHRLFKLSQAYKLGPLKGVFEHYLYFKYIVRNSPDLDSAEFLKDYNLLYTPTVNNPQRPGPVPNIPPQNVVGPIQPNPNPTPNIPRAIGVNPANVNTNITPKTNPQAVARQMQLLQQPNPLPTPVTVQPQANTIPLQQEIPLATNNHQQQLQQNAVDDIVKIEMNEGDGTISQEFEPSITSDSDYDDRSSYSESEIAQELDQDAPMNKGDEGYISDADSDSEPVSNQDVVMKPNPNANKYSSRSESSGSGDSSDDGPGDDDEPPPGNNPHGGPTVDHPTEEIPVPLAKQQKQDVMKPNPNAIEGQQLAIEPAPREFPAIEAPKEKEPEPVSDQNKKMAEDLKKEADALKKQKEDFEREKIAFEAQKKTVETLTKAQIYKLVKEKNDAEKKIADWTKQQEVDRVKKEKEDKEYLDRFIAKLAKEREDAVAKMKSDMEEEKNKEINLMVVKYTEEANKLDSQKKEVEKALVEAKAKAVEDIQTEK
jgi:hypothetical protein